WNESVGKNAAPSRAAPLKWPNAVTRGMDWATTVTGVKFPHPLLLASGILNETGVSMARAAREGAGGVITKSMSLKARNGHPGPNVVEVEGGLLNAMGLPGPGVAHFADEVAVARKAGTVLVGSVF